LITAISWVVSIPIILASNCLVSVRMTFISVAPSTTCAFVRMNPSTENITPEPIP